MATKKNKSPKLKEAIVFPQNILMPVKNFLSQNLALWEKREKELKEEDPFSHPGRVSDNASPDTDAEEQFGHAKNLAIRTELERKIIQTRRALARIYVGKYGICEKCHQMIDTDRLMISPEAAFCVKCETKPEKT